jgi:hypothetical protein
VSDVSDALLLVLVQILASPELRKQYDAHGSEGLDANLVNGALFFTCLFGSDRFEHLIGELLIAVAARSGGDLNMAEMKEAQVRVAEPGDLSPALGRCKECPNNVDCAHVKCSHGVHRGRPSGWRRWSSC